MIAHLFGAECHHDQRDQGIEYGGVFASDVGGRQGIQIDWTLPSGSVVYEGGYEMARAVV